jgi:predicted lipid-binding transport protein (Tim44 family)
MQVALLVALLLATPAYAMNKCIGANGRITYQQDPCPGTVVRGVPKPPAVEAPATPAAPAEAPAAEPARPVIVEGNTACDRVRQKIAEIYEGWPALSPQQIVEAERMIARTKQEYSYCKW